MSNPVKSTALSIARKAGFARRATQARAIARAAFRVAFPRRFDLVQLAGLAMTLTGVSQWSVPTALVLGGIVLTVAGELHGAASEARLARICDSGRAAQ